MLVTPSRRSLSGLGTVLPGIGRVSPLALLWQDTLDVQVHRIYIMQITLQGGLRRLIRSGQSLEDVLSNAVDTDNFLCQVEIMIQSLVSSVFCQQDISGTHMRASAA